MGRPVRGRIKVAVVGPGAMGCLFAALLSRSKARPEVYLLDEDAARARKIARQGIVVSGLTRLHRKVEIVADAAKIGPCDLVIIFTKSYDTARALDSIGPLLSPKTKVLTLQNGLGNLELIARAVGKDRAWGGATAHGSTLLGVGDVRHAGRGETIIGRPDGKVTADLRRTASLFSGAGIPTRISKNIDGVIWSKLIVNAGINALASVTGFRNGGLLEHEGTREVMRRAVEEAVRTARRKKMKLAYRDPVRKVESVCRATAANISSMLQDVTRKKRTEIDFINGAVVREGKRLGIKTPVNEMLVRLVKDLESG